MCIVDIHHWCFGWSLRVGVVVICYLCLFWDGIALILRLTPTIEEQIMSVDEDDFISYLFGIDKFPTYYLRKAYYIFGLCTTGSALYAAIQKIYFFIKPMLTLFGVECVILTGILIYKLGFKPEKFMEADDAGRGVLTLLIVLIIKAYIFLITFGFHNELKKEYKDKLAAMAKMEAENETESALPGTEPINVPDSAPDIVPRRVQSVLCVQPNYRYPRNTRRPIRDEGRTSRNGRRNRGARYSVHQPRDSRPEIRPGRSTRHHSELDEEDLQAMANASRSNLLPFGDDGLLHLNLERRYNEPDDYDQYSPSNAQGYARGPVLGRADGVGFFDMAALNQRHPDPPPPPYNTVAEEPPPPYSRTFQLNNPPN